MLPRLRRLFDAIDADRNGSLDPSELEAAATRLESSLEAGLAAGLDGQDDAAATAAMIREAARRCLESDDEDGCLVAYSFADFVARVAPVEAGVLAAAALEGPPTPLPANGGPAANGGAPAAACLAVDGGGVPAVGRSKAERFDGYVSELLAVSDAVARVDEEGAGGPLWEGRTGELVAGCVAGARNAALVDALRVVYCDNAILRRAGDLVFRAFLRPRLETA